jgi:hypothetical protein
MLTQSEVILMVTTTPRQTNIQKVERVVLLVCLRHFRIAPPHNQDAADDCARMTHSLAGDIARCLHHAAGDIVRGEGIQIIFDGVSYQAAKDE